MYIVTICSTRGISRGKGCWDPTYRCWLVSVVSDLVRCSLPTSRWPPLLYPLVLRHLSVLTWMFETCPVCVWWPNSHEFSMLENIILIWKILLCILYVFIYSWGVKLFDEGIKVYIQTIFFVKQLFWPSKNKTKPAKCVLNMILLIMYIW